VGEAKQFDRCVSSPQATDFLTDFLAVRAAGEGSIKTQISPQILELIYKKINKTIFGQILVAGYHVLSLLCDCLFGTSGRIPTFAVAT
jgi:hypothetical protein